MNNIPEKINSFNIYNAGTVLVGLSDEVTLPDFEAMTETLSGPGILGELESVAIGQFGSMELEVPFRQMDEDLFTLVDQCTAIDLTLRGSIQFTVGSTGATDFKPMRVVVRGKNKNIGGGKAKQGNGTGSTVKLEISYILIEIDSKPMIELDKLNFVFKVNGKDLLEKVRRMC
ncbi:MAG: phage major tail tube protein [Lachnospiraceae bacterium]